MFTSSVAAFFLVILTVIFVDIFCGNVTNLQSSNNAWQITPTTNNKNLGPQLDPHDNSKSTTAWPVLGQRRPTSPSNNSRQAQWVQRNNIWVRNSQSNVNVPSTNRHASSSFISRESGQNLEPQNQANVQQQGSNSGVSQYQNVGQRMATQGNTQNTGVNRNVNYRNIMIQPWSTSTSSPSNNNQNRLYMGILGPNAGPTMPVLSNKNQIISGPSTENNLNNQENPNNAENDETDLGNRNRQQSGGVDDNELREFSEVLLTKDVNNPNKYVTVNYQGMTSSRSTNDEAPEPLLTVDRRVYELESIEKLIALYNNYILETNQNEVYTGQEKIEENNLLDAVLSTPVMQYTRNFLISKGKIGKDPREFKDILRLIWFSMYSRGGGRIGSSGFEHVFLAELKGNQVSGLHNWLYFSEEESKNQANYLGYMKKISLGDKGAILKYHFTFHDVDKPVGSMFIGTSPELEMALYSTCFLLRAGRICPLKMNGNRFIIRTYTYRYRGKNTIGSAFPEI